MVTEPGAEVSSSSLEEHQDICVDQACILDHFYMTFINIPVYILLQLWMWLPSICNP